MDRAARGGHRRGRQDRPGPGRRQLSYGDAQVPGEAELAQALLGLTREYDPQRGGFGGVPQFPPSMVIEFLLRHHARTGAEGALQMAADTCERMARGGIYDQLGGGFARYSVDRDWVVPHFEKMLYDNALLCRVYAHLALHRLRTGPPGRPGDRRFPGPARAAHRRGRLRLRAGRRQRRRHRPARGGRVLRVDAEQLREVLGDSDADLAADFGVTEEGTFEDRASVLQLPQQEGVFDADRVLSVRERLLAARARRPAPGRDDKVMRCWNGLAIAALAETGAYFDRPDLVEVAVAAADLLVRRGCTWTTRGGSPAPARTAGWCNARGCWRTTPMSPRASWRWPRSPARASGWTSRDCSSTMC
ncbi:hypothetical protein SFUMM280S_07829 [Streptomyces fumanus]